MNKTILEINEKQIVLEDGAINGAISFKEDIPVLLYLEIDQIYSIRMHIINGDTSQIKSLANIMNEVINELPKEE